MIYHVDAFYNNGIGGSFVSGLVFADSTEHLLHDYDYLSRLTSYAAITQVRPGEVQYVSWTEYPGGLNNDTVTTAFIQPLPSKWTDVGGVRVENVRYRGRVVGIPCYFKEYEFARFDESLDSLVVYGLVWKRSGNSIVPGRRAFPKANVKATLDDDGFVERLEVKEFVTGVHPGYRTSQPLDLVDVPTACVGLTRLDHLGPDRQRISDDGVFKRFWSCSGQGC